jgi:hypothetical protein
MSFRSIIIAIIVTLLTEPFHLIWLWTFKPHSCGRIFSQLFLGWRAGVRGGVASGAKVFGRRAVRDRYGIFYIISSFE